MKLVLPLPPSPNRRKANPFAEHREKRAYQAATWLSACAQHRPQRRPPEVVVVEAVLFLPRKRDDDNATASVKWALDALRREQAGDLRWRQGVADLCGYFVDDAPQYLRLAGVRQVVDREHPRLEITITPAEQRSA